MIVNYTLSNGEETAIEVSDEIGNFIIDSRRIEENGNRKERYHCISLDAFTYEGSIFATGDFAKEIEESTEERDRAVRRAFAHLTKTQKRRLLMLAGGLSIREIAEREHKDFKSGYESIEAGKKKFLKFFPKTPHQNGL